MKMFCRRCGLRYHGSWDCDRRDEWRSHDETEGKDG